jgi:Kef-type K+ transport system membrane component KefB
MVFETTVINFLRVVNLPIVNILFLLVVVWIAGEFFEKLNLPAVLGELLAGLIIGPPLLNIVTMTDGLDMLAKLGMFFLMFYAGLGTDPKQLFKVSRSALSIGILGTIVPFLLGLIAVLGLGGTLLQGMFIGAAISGTSMVTKSRILHDLKVLRTKLGHTIMGSAMIDNMLSFIILAVVIKSVIVGEFNFYSASLTLVEATLFFLLSIFIGYKLYPAITKFMKQQTARGFTFAIILGLFFAFFAEMMRIHFIIGAYLAGLMVREEIVGQRLFSRLKERFRAISLGFLGPLFIVTVAFKVDFRAVIIAPLLFLAILIAAFVGKILGAGSGAYFSGSNVHDSVSIGLGMNGRGTVELVLAVVGLELGILTINHVTILVMVAFITTLVVPYALSMRIPRMSKHLLKK